MKYYSYCSAGLIWLHRECQLSRGSTYNTFDLKLFSCGLQNVGKGEGFLGLSASLILGMTLKVPFMVNRSLIVLGSEIYNL